jgi:hypothetical protein
VQSIQRDLLSDNEAGVPWAVENCRSRGLVKQAVGAAGTTQHAADETLGLYLHLELSRMQYDVS